MATRFLCIGACNIDQTLRTQSAVIFGSSQPVATTSGFGGVARNVAVNLSRLECDAGLITLLGADDDGRRLIEDCQAHGVDTAGAALTDRAENPRYTAVLDDVGQLVLGLADMSVYDLMTPEWLEERRDIVDATDVVLADANLPADSLAWLAKRSGPEQVFCAEAVSDIKAVRLANILEQFDHLFCNGSEAAVLAKTKDAGEACQRLAQLGCKRVTVTLAERGLVAIDRDGTLTRLAAAKVELADPTGAGDALIAAMLFALYEEGATLDQALALGRAAAAMTLECKESVADTLTRQSLFARVVAQEAEESR